MVHTWGVLGSINGPHCRVNKWSTSFRSIKIGVSEVLLSQFFRGVCRVFVFFFSGVLVQKQAFKKMWKIGFSFFVLMLARKTIKQGFFGHPLLERREREKRREARGQKNTTIFPSEILGP